jgi:hypothetical protein
MHMLSLLTYFAITQAECDDDKAQRLLGIIPKWYKYMDYKAEAVSDKCAIHLFKTEGGEQVFHFEALLPIGLSVIEMLLALAGVVAVGFVMYGGFQYVTSQGEPDRTKAALHTIINAFVGGAITVVASAIVAFLGSRLVPLP